jgi:hypothetical protein
MESRHMLRLSIRTWLRWRPSRYKKKQEEEGDGRSGEGSKRWVEEEKEGAKAESRIRGRRENIQG